MLRNALVAQRYSKSLFEITQEGDSTKADQVLAELKTFSKVMQSNPEVASFFLNPTVSRSDKLEVVTEVATSLASVEKFLKLLIEADRLDCLDDIVQDFEATLETESGEIRVELRVARDMSEKSIREVTQLIESKWGRKPRFDIVKDPKILGGFVAKAAGRTLDSSVKSQLRLLESDLSAAN